MGFWQNARRATVEHGPGRSVSQQVGYGFDQPLVTAAVFKTELLRANSAVANLFRDVSSQVARMDATWLASFNDFIRRWGEFYLANVDNFFAPSGGTYDQCLDFQREAATWRQDFQRRGGTVSSPTPIPADPSSRAAPGGPIASNKGLIGGALVVAGIFAIGYALSNVPIKGGD